jgi:hypothetical protein
MIRNETFQNGICIRAKIIDLDAGTYTLEVEGVITEGPRPLTEEEWLTYDPPPSQGELVVSAWTIPADGEHYAVCTFGTDEPVWFTVNGEPLEVPSEQGRATLEIAADAPGAIRVEIHDKQATIMAVAP